MSSIESMGRRQERNPQGEGVSPEFMRQIHVGIEEFRMRDPEAATWYSEFVSRIDMTELRNIYAEVARRSGASDRAARSLNEADIHVVTGAALMKEKDYARVVDGSSVVLINGDQYAKYLHDSSVSEELQYAHNLETLLHEFAHIVGGNSISRQQRFDTVHTGYSERTQYAGFQTDAFHLFNEGITEMIKDRVIEEYLRRKPMMLPGSGVLTLQAFARLREKMKMGADYEAAVVFRNRLMEHLSTQLGIERAAVENAFITGYFQKSALREEDVSALFDEIVGLDFVDALADAKSKEDFLTLAQMYQFKPLSQEDKGRTLQFIRSFFRGGSKKAA